MTTVENHRERTYPVLIVGTHISISQNPNYGLFLVYDMTDSSATIAHINFVLWWFLCTAYCGASVVWIVTRFVVRPITQTAITAEKLAAGDLDQRVCSHGEHQAARLGYSFNLMAELRCRRKLFSWSACRLCSSASYLTFLMSCALRCRRCVWD